MTLIIGLLCEKCELVFQYLRKVWKRYRKYDRNLFLETVVGAKHLISPNIAPFFCNTFLIIMIIHMYIIIIAHYYGSICTSDRWFGKNHEAV